MYRKDLKSVYELPQSVKEVKKVLKKISDDKDKLLIIQRIRDYHNPLLDPKKEDNFKQFIVYLLTYYIQKDSDSKAIL